MIDENKHVIREAKIPCTVEAVENFFMGIPKDCLNVVIEAVQKVRYLHRPQI